jgi:hypothetical protein
MHISCWGEIGGRRGVGSFLRTRRVEGHGAAQAIAHLVRDIVPFDHPGMAGHAVARVHGSRMRIVT